MPISKEYDMIRENYHSSTKVDRSQWLSRLLEARPEIKSLREKVLPVNRAVEFGRLFLLDERMVQPQTLLSLISQHLHTLGLVESEQTLHEEWNEFSEIPLSLDRSQLTLLVQRGIMHAESFWDKTGSGKLSGKDRKELSNVIGVPPQGNMKALAAEPLDVDFEQPENLTVRDGEIVGATLNQLIWICTTDNRMKTPELVKMVCLMYPSFCTPQLFFAKLKERMGIALVEKDLDMRSHQVELIITFVCEWLKENRRELEPSMVLAVRQWAASVIQQGYPHLVAKLQEATEDERDSGSLMDWKVGKDKYDLVQWIKDQSPSSRMFLKPADLARQLTIWTSRYFFNIKRSELLDGNWEEDKNLSPNVARLLEQENALPTWVYFVTMEKPAQFKQREDVIEYFLDVAKVLFEMKNFLSFMWIALGIQGLIEMNLKEICSRVNKQDLEWLNKEVERFMDGSENWKAPMSFMKSQLKEGKPVIPYTYAYFNRICKITRVVGTMRSENPSQENIPRAMAMVKEITAFEQFQKYRYHLIPIDQIQDLIESIKKVDQELLDRMRDEINGNIKKI